MKRNRYKSAMSRLKISEDFQERTLQRLSQEQKNMKQSSNIKGEINMKNTTTTSNKSNKKNNYCLVCWSCRLRCTYTRDLLQHAKYDTWTAKCSGQSAGHSNESTACNQAAAYNRQANGQYRWRHY